MVQPYPKVQASELDIDFSDTSEPSAHGLFGRLDSRLSFDASHPGKHHGHLIVPLDEPTSPQRHLRLPVCIIRGRKIGAGQNVTLLSGIHGDEIEGPLSLQSLAQKLNADDIQGCLTVLPSINLNALLAGTRCSPLDARDIDRCFPGKASGTISERIAFEMFERFIRPADLVVDFRSGGADLRFAASAAVRFPSRQPRKQDGRTKEAQDSHYQKSLARNRISEAAMIAFGAPNSLRLPASTPNSCLQAATESAAIPYLQTELGGGGASSAQTLAIAQTGCDNLLRHTGLLEGDIELRATRMLEVRDASAYVFAAHRGILQPHARLGHEVYRGDPLASIINLEDTGAPPHVIRVPHNGVLLALRDQGQTEPGDLLAIVADEVQG